MGSYTPIAQVFRGILKRQLLIAFETLPTSPSIASSSLDNICAELKSLSPRPDLLASFARLKQAGFDVYAVSNGGAANTEGLIQKAVKTESVDVKQLGVHVISTDEIKKAKPEIAIYEHVLKQAGISPGEDTWFCAAHSWDLAGAKKAGFKTAFLAFEEFDSSPEIFGEPDLTVSSFRELADRLTSYDSNDLDALETSFSLENTLNALFPDETSFKDINAVQLRLAAQIQRQRSESAALQHELSSTSEEDGDRMAQLQELIGDLFTQISHLRTGATESEVVVCEITRDIKALTIAKKNIVSSMTGVKRFQMLVNGFDQLTRLAKAKRYRETAQSLLAIKELQAYFRSYTAVERIHNLFRGIQEVQAIIRDQVMAEFRASFAPEASKASRNLSLVDACLVVDALGDDARKQLLEWFTLLQMKEYKRIFTPASEAGHLDNISRRYGWFRRVLNIYEDEYAYIFPARWNVGGVLLAVFAHQTRDDLKSVLAKVASSLKVGLLLDSLQMTVEFEAEMSRKFGLQFEELVALVPPIVGQPAPISTTFEPYLSVFVDAQDRTLSEMVSSYKASSKSISHSADDPDHFTHVLPSSFELFYFYRETLEKCAQLSNKSPFLDLCGVFKKWLKIYSEDVLAASLNMRDVRRSSSDTRPNLNGINNACLVVNTADYCAETAAQLEDRLKEKIHPELKERVSVEIEKDVFLSTIALAIQTLLHELEFTVEPAFQQMARSPWKEFDFVSSESTYVADLVRAIESVVDVVKAKIEQRKYVRSFADHVVGLIIAKFQHSIVRCRPISITGAEQILLDLRALKSCLLTLAATSNKATASNASYTRYVGKHVGRLETLLKGIMTPEDPAEEFVKHYLVLIPCQSFSDFQKMLDFKGVRRIDQNALLDVFLAKTSSMSDLSDTSFLSSIDMDPNSVTHLTGAPHSPSLSTGFFGGFAMLTNSSRDGSANPTRASTPQLGHTAQGAKGVSFADGVKAGALPDPQKFDFKRFGRLFGREQP